jgi:hypothetical protein
VTGAAPSLSQIRAQVTAVRRKNPEERVIAIRSPGRWTDQSEQVDGDETFLIRQCDSPLAFREALREATGSDTTKVLITPLEEQDLGGDILVRVARRKLFRIDNWEIVRSLFQAHSVDPRLTRHNWIADILLEEAPPQGYAPARGGFLDAETVWALLLRRRISLPSEAPDLTGLLKWSIDSEAVRRFRESPDELRRGVIEWLANQSGPVAEAILRFVVRTDTPDALPLGLAAAVVFHPDALNKLQKAAGRLEERYFEGRAPNVNVVRRWGAAAAEVVRLQLTDASMKRKQIERSDEILRDLRADGYAYLSDTSPTGFNQRLAALGKGLETFLQDERPALLDSLWKAGVALRAHDRAAAETRRLERVEMAFRLVRWLVVRRERLVSRPASLVEAAERHLSEGSFVDRARLALRVGDPVPELSKAFAKLFDVVTEIREREARDFAELLRDWTTAGSTGDGVIPVERIVEQIVGPLAAEAPVLLVLIDGMSAAVCHELVGDLTRHDWIALTESGRTVNRAGIATIPSVTEFSRTSLLCGRREQGSSNDEKAGFEKSDSLLKSIIPGFPPILFHKPTLQDSGDPVLAGRVREEIASADRRIVGVIINAVDDHLLKGEQVDKQWTREEIRIIPPLLYEARGAGRLVVLVSDHGHVLEVKTESRAHEGSGERWRPAEGAPQPDEIEVHGDRVMTPSKRLIAAWSERLRYGGKRNGYHGGLNPQEMVVPIVVLAPPDSGPSGWREAPPGTPAWWEETVVEEPQPEPPIPPLKPAWRPETLFDMIDESIEIEPAKRGARERSEWILRLLSSEVFQEQKRLGGRGIPEDEVIERFLTALERSGGKLTSAALARRLNFPFLRLRGLVAVLQRVLNIDGYPILSRDEVSDTIELNRSLLLKQFDLE